VGVFEDVAVGEVEGNDDARGVAGGEPDVSAEEAVVEVLLGDEARAGMAVQGDPYGTVAGEAEVGLAE